MPSREQPGDIEDAATVWAAMGERGLTPAEQVELDQWLEGDSRRLGAFVRAQAAWIHAERAAALGEMPIAEATTLAEALTAKPAPRSMPSRRMILGGGGAIAASIGVAGFMASQRYRTLESGVGEIRHIELLGGTVLTLDTDTRVDVALSSDDRKLELKRGRLFLEVAEHRDLPLLVTVGDLVLETAEGAFGLVSIIEDPITALVTRGRLAVSQSRGIFEQPSRLAVAENNILTLRPGAQLVAGDVRPIVAGQRDQFLAWRDGMLSFGGEALATAVRAFDRYGPLRIVIADAQLGRQKITGLFKANDPRGFATAVAASFDGVVSMQGEIIRITARTAASA